jgi:hypothetical protein
MQFGRSGQTQIAEKIKKVMVSAWRMDRNNVFKYNRGVTGKA